MQDLRSCFFTNEFNIVDENAEEVELMGSVDFCNSKIGDKCICNLLVVTKGKDEDELKLKTMEAVRVDKAQSKDPIEAQRNAFRRALFSIADKLNWEVTEVKREEMEVF